MKDRDLIDWLRKNAAGDLMILRSAAERLEELLYCIKRHRDRVEDPSDADAQLWDGCGLMDMEAEPHGFVMMATLRNGSNVVLDKTNSVYRVELQEVWILGEPGDFFEKELYTYYEDSIKNLPLYRQHKLLT